MDALPTLSKVVLENPYFPNIEYSSGEHEEHKDIWKSLNAIDFAVFSGTFKDWKIMAYRAHSPSSLLNA